MERKSLGEGRVQIADLAAAGADTVIEPGVRIFGPQYIYLGERVYVGHDAFLRAYPKGHLQVGHGCWLGPGCFINSYGGVTLGTRVGIGPGVKILSSAHRGKEPGRAIIDTDLVPVPVEVADGADIGAGAILLPGARVGQGAQVGAGAVVTGEVAAHSVVVGVPAKVLR